MGKTKHFKKTELTALKEPENHGQQNYTDYRKLASQTIGFKPECHWMAYDYMGVIYSQYHLIQNYNRTIWCK